MNKELMEALDVLEKEKEISKETLFEAIENSLLTACKNHFGKADNIKVEINRETCDFLVYAEKYHPALFYFHKKILCSPYQHHNFPV